MRLNPDRGISTPLYIFGVPGKLGGASTKIRHLIFLLRDVFNLTVVLSAPSWLKYHEVTAFLKSQGVGYCLLKDLPRRLTGVALVICEMHFFSTKQHQAVKDRGMKLVFSNEMMWEFKGEAEAVKAGFIDKVLFVSDFQAAKFAELYRGIPSAICGNYVAPEDFEFKERRNGTFTIGRLSRPDPDKYPEDFPVFYEELGLKDVRYRVMAWDEKLKQKYQWHRFGPEWELLRPQKEDAEKFLHSLDLFVYPLGHKFKESWGRSTVESMLTGCIPLLPAGHQFHNLIVHGESGFICRNFSAYQDVVHELHDNHPLRQRLSRQCTQHARTKICNPDEHRKIWIDALTV
jgi:glycosyltransferase involved in cell wall biosynthesis